MRLLLCILLAYAIHAIEITKEPTAVLMHSAVKIRPEDSISVTGTFQTYSARNEYHSFQIVLIGPQDIHSVSVSTLFEGTPAKLYRQAYLNVTTESDCYGKVGRWPDPLVPDVDVFFNEKRNAFPFSVPAGENRAMWVDMFIPEDAKPGDYSGFITINGNEKVQFTLTVWDFALPSTVTNYSLMFGFSIDSAAKAHYGNDNYTAWLELTKLYQEEAMMHRVTLGDFSESDFSINTDKPDFDKYYDNWHTFFNGHELPYGLKEAKITSCQILAKHCYSFPNCTSTQIANQIQYWKDVVAFFKKQGWFDTLFDYTQDEPHTPFDFEKLTSRSIAVHKADPDLRVLCTTEMDKAVSRNITEFIDLWVPIINYMEPKNNCYEVNGNQRSAYDKVNTLWWYQSCMSDGCGTPGCDSTRACEMGWPSYVIDHSAINNRIMSWMSYLYDIQGELYWSTNYAMQGKDPWHDIYYFTGNGDGTFFYPGTPDIIGGSNHIPVSSIRFKQVRDGIEDREYMKLAEKKVGKAKVMKVIEQVVSNDYTFSKDDSLFLKVRKELASLCV